jgi:hypothetical protein
MAEEKVLILICATKEEGDKTSSVLTPRYSSYFHVKCLFHRTVIIKKKSYPLLGSPATKGTSSVFVKHESFSVHFYEEKWEQIITSACYDATKPLCAQRTGHTQQHSSRSETANKQAP